MNRWLPKLARTRSSKPGSRGSRRTGGTCSDYACIACNRAVPLGTRGRAFEGNDTLEGNDGIDTLSGGDGADVLVPSPADGVFVLPDGKFDSMDCGELFLSDGDPGDTAFRVLADGDLANDCANVIGI
jgi:Ca2+-binding RTX toxin-like protein